MATDFSALRSKWGLPPGGLLQSGKTPEEIAEEEEEARRLEAEIAAAAEAEQARQIQASAKDPLAPLPEEGEEGLKRIRKKVEEDLDFEDATAAKGEDLDFEDDQGNIIPSDEPFQLDTTFKFEQEKETPGGVASDTGPLFEPEGIPKAVEEAAAGGARIETSPTGYGIIPKGSMAVDPDAVATTLAKTEAAKGGKQPPSLVIDPSVLDEVTAPTAPLGGIARQHTAADKEIAARPSSNYEVDLTKAAYLERVSKEINGRKLWDAAPGAMLAEARRIAAEEFEDPNLAKAMPFDFGAIAKYRKEQGTKARPSPVGWSAVGEKTTEEPGDKTYGEIVQTSRIKSGRNAMATIWSAREAVEEGLGIDSKHSANRRRYYGAISGALPPGLTARQVSSFKDAANWATQTAIEQAPNFVASMDAAMLGGLVGGSIAAQAGAFGTSYIMELGQIQQGNKEINEEAKAGLATFLSAGGAAALDSFLPGKLGSTLTNRFGKEIADDIGLKILLMPATEARRATLRQIAKQGGKGMGGEFITEGLQTAIEEYGSALETGTPIKPGLVGRMFDAAAAGALIGGPAGVATGVAELEQAKTAPLREAESIEWNTSGVGQALLSPSRRAGEVAGKPADLRAAKTPAVPVVLSEPERERQARPRLVRPTPAPVDATGKTETHVFPKGVITSKPGPRKSFRTANGQMASSNHGGYDIGGMKKGAPIGATASGVIVSAAPARGYGNRVIVEHSDGSRSTYAHLNNINVKVGDQVAQGQKLGGAGQTGNATGVHLHYELRDRNGAPLNPRNRQVAGLEQAPDTGEWVDPSGMEVAQTPVDYGEDTAEELAAMDEAFTEATGQQWDEEDFAPTEEEAEAAIARGGLEPEVAPAMGEEVEERRPSVRRGAVSDALDEGGVPDPTSTQQSAEASLDAAKAANPARAALAEMTAAPSEAIAEAGMAAEAAAPAGDYTQPLPGEQPLYGQDETGAQTQEVVGFVNPETDEVRMMGEPPGGAQAMGGPFEPAEAAGIAPPVAEGPLPEELPPSPPTAVPTAPIAPITATAIEWTPPAEHEGLAVDQRAAVLKAMPKSPRGAAFETKAGRSIGQSVGLGMSEAPSLKGQSPKFKAAYKVGLLDAKAGVAKAKTASLVSAAPSEVAPPTTPVAAKGSKATPKGKKIPALKAKLAAAKAPPPTVSANDQRIADGYIKDADAIERKIAGKKSTDMVRPPWGDASPQPVSELQKLATAFRAEAAKLTGQPAEAKEQAQPETKQAEPAPTPTRPTKEPVRAAEAKKIPAAKPAAVSDEVKAKIKDIRKRAEKIEAKMDDITTYEDHGPGRTKAKAFLKTLVNQGVISQSVLDANSDLLADKDMGASDIFDEFKHLVEEWRDGEIAALEGPAVAPKGMATLAAGAKKRVETGPAPTATYTDPHGRKFYYPFYPQALQNSATLTGQNPDSVYMFVAGGGVYYGTTTGTEAAPSQKADQADIEGGQGPGVAGAAGGAQAPRYGEEEQLELFPGMDFGSDKARPPAFVTVDGVERPSTNADGQPIAATTKAVKNFWQWFGDSKAVDDQGRPRIFYHGTRTSFEEFGNWKASHFFSDNPEVSRTYAKGADGAVLPVYLRINEVDHYDAEGRNWTEVVVDEGEHSEEAIDEAREAYINDQLESFDADANRLITVERKNEAGETVFDVVEPRRAWQAETVEDEVLATFEDEDEAQEFIVERVDEETQEHMDNLNTSEWELINHGYLDQAESHRSTDDVAEMAQHDYDAVWIDDVDDTAGGESIPSTVIIVLKGSEESRAPRSIKSATENTGEFSPESSLFKRRKAKPAPAKATPPKPKAPAKKKAPTTIEEYIAPPAPDPVEIHEIGQFHQKHLYDMVAALDEFGLTGKHGLIVQIIQAEIAIAKGMTGAGQYGHDMITGNAVMQIAAFDWENARQTARHEGIHWMRDNDIISPKQWEALKRWALSDPTLMAWAEANYPLGPDMDRDGQIEEAIAEGYARWELGQPLHGQREKNPDAKVAERFFNWLSDMIQHIRMAYAKAGVSERQLNEAMDLLINIRTGEQLRAWDKAQENLTARAKPALRTKFEQAVAKALALADITVSEAHVLRSIGEAGIKAREAWHGTPRQMIERFSNAYINTGEKVQAKGWGLYFADKKGVADWYRAKLTMDMSRPATISVTVDGHPIIDWVGNKFGDVSQNSEWEVATFEVASLIHDYLTKGGTKYNGWLDTLHVAYDKGIHGALADAQTASARHRIEADQRKVENIFNGLRMRDVAFDRGPTTGALYKVDIPETDVLLDLDKKLSEQPEVVTAALTKLRGHLVEKGLLPQYQRKYGDFWSWTGEALQLNVLGRELLKDGGFPAAPADSELGVAITEDDGPKAASLYLRELGIPGNQYLDRDSRDPAQTTKTRNYVIFDDSLIEITGKEVKVEWGKTAGQMIQLGGAKRRITRAAQPSVLGDPSKPDPGALRHMHDVALNLLTKLGSWDFNAESDAADNLIDAFKRKILQKYRQVEKGQTRAEAFLGVDRLPPEMNVMERITADERGYKMDHMVDNLFRPMAEELARSKLAVADLGLYLYARHAPARNRAVAKINPAFNLTDKPGSGMTDTEAGDIMSDFIANGQMADLQAAAVYIDKMIEMAQRERVNGKLLTQKNADAGFQPQDHYVPLRGHEKTEPQMEMSFPVEGSGFSVKGSEGHRMFGRESRADLESIVGYAVAQAQQAIDRSYRNSVSGALYNMLRAVPDPSFVKIDRVERVATWNKKTKQVEYQMQTRVAPGSEEDKLTVYYKDGDVTHKMTFQKGNQSAVRFVKAIKNLDVETLPSWIAAGRTLTKLWTQANTSWNIDFILRNAVKDVQTGVINASTLGEKGIRRQIIKNLPGALYASTRGVFSKTGAGEASGSKWFEWYNEFEAAGGKINYNQTEGLEDILRRTKREMKLAKQSGFTNPIKAVRNVLGFVSNLSSALENMTRLSAYVALREAGIPSKQAAQAVRELTTNFQQHGEWGPKINAFYGFATASTTGGGRFLYSMRKKPLIMVGLMTAGLMMDVLNHLLDPEKWDDYTEEEKDQAFKLMLPDYIPFDISIPVGYGINSFVTVGRKSSEWWREKTDKDGNKQSMMEMAADVMYSFANAFSPVSGHTVGNLITPSVGDPVVDIIQNSNNWGHKLYPDEWPGTEDDPQSHSSLENTNEFWKVLATGMNELTGGNDVKKGSIDVHPETLSHFTSETLGGLGRSIGRVWTLPGKLTRDEVGPSDIPVARGFISQPHGAANVDKATISTFNERYYSAKKAVDKAKDVATRYGTDSPQYKEHYEENKAAIKMATPIKVTATAVRKIGLAKGALEDGLVNAKGLTEKQANAIEAVTGDTYPVGKKLTQAQADASRAKIEKVRLALAKKFDQVWQKKVMGTASKDAAPTSP